MKTGPTILAILYATPESPGDERQPPAKDAQERLAVDPQKLGAPFETTLEEALAAIERQPRGYVEPDGSFSLHGESGENSDSGARIDGEVYDFVVPGIGSRVHHVDVRGPAVAELWQPLFDALSPRGAEGVVVFLPDAGEALSGEAFLARIGPR
ncbi:MAG TPA: hypothetical protein VGN57_11775 [Pirellulaceae bacterium]|jgi:hypothetical protein|nr:hypothetical protein [Pirellulaceae bacterium]